ncbi:MAG: NUDIX hydrolase [Promethearchaeota archaeon]
MKSGDLREMIVVGIVYKEVSGMKRYLLLKERRIWNFPGGKVKIGEILVIALRRELMEEIKINELMLSDVLNPNYVAYSGEINWKNRSTRRIITLWYFPVLVPSDWVASTGLEHCWLSRDDISRWRDGQITFDNYLIIANDMDIKYNHFYQESAHNIEGNAGPDSISARARNKWQSWVIFIRCNTLTSQK